MDRKAEDGCRSNSISVREGERDVLIGAVEDLHHSGVKILELSGGPGMGKSRLLSEVAGHARSVGIPVFMQRCVELEAGIEFGAFIAPFVDLLHLDSREDRVPGERYADGRAVGGNPSAIFRELRAAMGISWCQDNAMSSPGDSGRSLYQTARTLLEACARDGLVVILDDFHWADERSIGFLDYLIHQPTAAPALVLVAHRPKQASPKLRGALARGNTMGTSRRVELRPLTLNQAGQLTGLPMTSRRLCETYRASEGNPLYLLALAHARSTGRPAARALCGDAVFDQCAALILDELAGGSPWAQGLIDAAAVLGDEFDTAALSAVSGRTEGEVMGLVADLVRRDIFRPVDSTPRLSFRHPLLRRIRYSFVEPGELLTIHRRARAFLERSGAPAVDQAPHVERSLRSPDPHGFVVLTQAAKEEFWVSPLRAAHWLRAALRLIPCRQREDGSGDTREVGVRLKLAQALGYGGQLRSSRRVLQEVLHSVPLGAPEHRVAAVTFCALVECLLGRYAQGRALISAERESVGAGRIADQVELLVASGLVSLFDAEPIDQNWLSEARRNANPAAERGTRMGLLAVAGLNAVLRGESATAVRMVADCVPLVDALCDADVSRHAERIVMLGWVETWIGQTDAAHRHFHRVHEVAGGAGGRHVVSLALAGLSMSKFRDGHLVEARRAATIGLEVAGAMGSRHLRGLALAMNALCASWMDGPAESLRLAESAMDMLDGCGSWWRYVAVLSLTNAAAVNGDLERCGLLAQPMATGWRLPVVVQCLHSAFLELILRTWRGCRAEGVLLDWDPPLAKSQLQCLNELGELGYTLVVRARVVHAEEGADPAVDLYLRAAAAFARSGLAVLHARTLIQAADCAVAADRRREARTILNHAGEVAGRCGAGWLCDEAVRRSRTVESGQDVIGMLVEPPLAALTEREREIAGIASMGKRTKEIAAELHLSPRTVDVHLSHIYRKLNIRSRTALVRLVTESGGRPKAAARGVV